MKKIILSMTFILLTNATSAFAFVPQMSFNVNGYVAVARVWNTSFRPIVCNGVAYGSTMQGVVLNSWVNSLIISPNTFVEVYVYSNVYDPMTNSWAEIDCNIGW
jgi:hypothetical protein